jgi:hypothetical protein
VGNKKVWNFLGVFGLEKKVEGKKMKGKKVEGLKVSRKWDDYLVVWIEWKWKIKWEERSYLYLLNLINTPIYK